MWHLGGKHNQFRFVGDTLQFSHQHHVRRIANGNITLFDNGNFHSVLFQEEPIVASSSRAVEYDLNVHDNTATVKWQYKNMPYSNAAGSVQRLANGNTLIGTGNLSSPCAIEVNSSGNVVFQLSLPDRIVSYRAYKSDWTPAQVRTVKSTGDLALKSIFPNPAEHSTTVIFSAEVGSIELNISDVLGHTLRSLSQKISQAGENIFDLNVRDLPDGVYYCKLSQNGRISIKAIVVQK